jgi:hypothetical protein
MNGSETRVARRGIGTATVAWYETVAAAGEPRQGSVRPRPPRAPSAAETEIDAHVQDDREDDVWDRKRPNMR